MGKIHALPSFLVSAVFAAFKAISPELTSTLLKEFADRFSDRQTNQVVGYLRRADNVVSIVELHRTEQYPYSGWSLRHYTPDEQTQYLGKWATNYSALINAVVLDRETPDGYVVHDIDGHHLLVESVRYGRDPLGAPSNQKG